MPLIVNTNVNSLIAQRNLTNNTNALNRSMERLASGFRINRAADDAAGLQISEGLRTQIRGLSKASNKIIIPMLNIIEYIIVLNEMGFILNDSDIDFFLKFK